MNRTACPDCGSDLGFHATKCRCGWKAANTSDGKPRPPCSWEGCRQNAMVFEEIEYGKGRHYLCEFHYVKAHALAATRRCEEKELFTIEQKKEYCRRLAGMLFKPMSRTKREPGQDDEERTAA